MVSMVWRFPIQLRNFWKALNQMSFTNNKFVSMHLPLISTQRDRSWLSTLILTNSRGKKLKLSNNLLISDSLDKTYPQTNKSIKSQSC